MIRAAAELAAVDLGRLDDRELAAEIRRRLVMNTGWVDSTGRTSSHSPRDSPIRAGVQRPAQAEDPYEFVSLLTQTDMASLERNRLLERSRTRCGAGLSWPRASSGDLPRSGARIRQELEDFIGRFGDLSCSVTGGTSCEGATGRS